MHSSVICKADFKWFRTTIFLIIMNRSFCGLSLHLILLVPHSVRNTFMYNEFSNCHILLIASWSLILLGDKTASLDVDDLTAIVSVDHLKPAFVPRSYDISNVDDVALKSLHT